MDTPLYLNNAASAWPRAPGVAEAVARCLEEAPSHPGRIVSRATDAVAKCRSGLARLLGVADPTRIVLTQNATHALNLAILGMGLRAGNRVVTTVMEHNSVLRPLAHLEERAGIHIDIIGLGEDGGLDTDAFERAVDRKPRLVVVNHASNVTGRITPAKRLFRCAKEAGATTLLDVSQSLGHIAVNAFELHADMVALTGHKGLRGPAGTGALYVAPGIELDQAFVGGTGVRSDLRLHPPDMPTRLEAGTPNVPALAGLSAALQWLDAEGEVFAAREQEAKETLRTGLREIPGVGLFDGDPGADGTAIVSFRVRGWDVEETGYVLAESFGIACRTGLHCAPLIHQALGSAPEGTVRFSPSGATTEEDIAYAVDAVRSLASKGRNAG